MSNRTDFRDYTTTLYRVISSPPGQRDWDSIRPLYHPGARLVRTGVNDQGATFASVLSVEEYIENAEKLLRDVSFSEQELSHQVTLFGNVAQLASVYSYRWQSGSEAREGRGVNFFTLVLINGSWQIMSIVWDNERPGTLLVDSGLHPG